MTRRKMWLRIMAVALPLFALIFLLHAWDRALVRDRWQQGMQNGVIEMRQLLTLHLHEVSGDVLSIAADRSLREQIGRNDLGSVADRFAALSRHKGFYEQVRYIDEHGMERIRIDHLDGKAINEPPKAMQNKAHRDYFINTSKLPDGALLISHIDLNIEHGKIERPFKPMLRFSSPIFDESGKRRGIVIINYSIGSLLEQFEQPHPQEMGWLMLLNAEGSWLAGGEEAKRWGGMLGNDNSFANEHPASWRYINAHVGDAMMQWQADGHIYAASALYPAGFVELQLGQRETPVIGSDPWLLVISETEPATMFHLANHRLQIAAAIVLTIITLWAFTMRNWRHLKRSSNRAHAEVHKLSQIVEQSSDMVFTTDTNGSIDYVNPAFTHMTGYTLDEALSNNPSLLKSGRHSPQFYEQLWQQIKAGESFHELFINARRDGELFYEQKTISPLIDRDNRITGYLSTGKDITDSKVARMAFYDQLTGLVNRALLMDRIKHEIAQCMRANNRIALLYLDLDGFKPINDRYGHQAGDELLIGFSDRIGAILRRSDTFARLGGDEFVILMSEIEQHGDAEQFADRIIATVSESWEVAGHSCTLGVSIGISYYPDGEIAPETLLERADIAMYAAKRAGKNRFVVYGAEMLPA